MTFTFHAGRHLAWVIYTVLQGEPTVSLGIGLHWHCSNLDACPAVNLCNWEGDPSIKTIKSWFGIFLKPFKQMSQYLPVCRKWEHWSDQSPCWRSFHFSWRNLKLEPMVTAGVIVQVRWWLIESRLSSYPACFLGLCQKSFLAGSPLAAHSCESHHNGATTWAALSGKFHHREVMEFPSLERWVDMVLRDMV